MTRRRLPAARRARPRARGVPRGVGARGVARPANGAAGCSGRDRARAGRLRGRRPDRRAGREAARRGARRGRRAQRGGARARDRAGRRRDRRARRATTRPRRSGAAAARATTSCWTRCGARPRSPRSPPWRRSAGWSAWASRRAAEATSPPPRCAPRRSTSSGTRTTRRARTARPTAFARWPGTRRGPDRGRDRALGLDDVPAAWERQADVSQRRAGHRALEPAMEPVTKSSWSRPHVVDAAAAGGGAPAGEGSPTRALLHPRCGRLDAPGAATGRPRTGPSRPRCPLARARRRTARSTAGSAARTRSRRSRRPSRTAATTRSSSRRCRGGARRGSGAT